MQANIICELANMFLYRQLDYSDNNTFHAREIKPVHPEGNQPWMFIGRTDAEAETPILWPPDAKNWLTGKDPDAEKDWRQEKKGTIEDEMVGWYRRLDEQEFEQALGVGKPGVLQSMGSQRVRYDWVTWTEP